MFHCLRHTVTETQARRTIEMGLVGVYRWSKGKIQLQHTTNLGIWWLSWTPAVSGKKKQLRKLAMSWNWYFFFRCSQFLFKGQPEEAAGLLLYYYMLKYLRTRRLKIEDWHNFWRYILWYNAILILSKSERHLFQMPVSISWMPDAWYFRVSKMTSPPSALAVHEGQSIRSTKLEHQKSKIHTPVQVADQLIDRMI